MRTKQALLGMAAAAAFSGASFSALAAPCSSAGSGGGLSSYFSGGINATCTVLDATISNVTFSSPTIPVSTALVGIDSTTNNPGFLFSVGTDIAGMATITFTVTAPSSNPMTDASLSFSPASDAGLLEFSETLSNGSSLSTSPGDITFAATTSLTVTDTYTTGTNSASSYFIENFSETPGATVPVPEPSSLALFGVGLSALGLMRRQKRL
jgi:PEP-CTERM motif